MFSKSLKFSVFALALMIGSLFAYAPQANAQNERGRTTARYSRMIYRNNDINDGRHRNDNRYQVRNVRFNRQPEIRFFTNCDYLRLRGLRIQDCRDNFYPRNIRIFDRDDRGNRIDLRNSYTGPRSININRVEIGVSHDYYMRLVNNIDISSTNDISVNTGDNTVSFNTRLGSFTTGDVNITIR